VCRGLNVPVHQIVKSASEILEEYK
jgi:hypothetical protein